MVIGRKPNLPYSCKARRRPCLDMGALDNASVAFSDQTDLTFLGHAGKIRRATSFRDIMVPVPVLPPVPVGLIKERQRTGSPPARFHVPDDEFEEIEDNLRFLQHLFFEDNHFEYTKKHLAVMRSHYR
nr:unnamed protein product [Spirometra erinaceieuropaei]